MLNERHILVNNKLVYLVFYIGFITAFSGFVWADDDDHEEKRGFSFFQQQAKASPLYQKECGECHLAFPARFLGQDSWQKIMTSLDNHFGDNAELAKKDADLILSYLSNNAANETRWGWGRGNGSLRISDNRHFKREHREVPSGAVGKNAKVKSLSDCLACHKHADKGSFRESEISIPGFRSWDD